MAKRKGVLGVILSRLCGFGFFILILLLANIFMGIISNPIILGIIKFLNSNLLIIILYTVLLFLGELFYNFAFPFNFPYPIFNACGSIFLVGFIMNILFAYGIGLPFKTLSLIIFPLVFLLVLVIGYLRVFGIIDYDEDSRKDKKEKKENKKSDNNKQKSKRAKSKTKKSKNIEWEDVGEEFKGMLYDFFKSIRKSLKKQ